MHVDRRRASATRDMAAFDLAYSPLLRLLLVITLFVAALNSSVNAAAAGTSSVSSTPGRGSPIEPPAPSLTVEPPDATGVKKALRYSTMGEGGPLLMSVSQHEVTTESNKPGEVRAKEDAPKRYTGSSSVVARKGVQDKIKPRKGVENITPKSIDQNMDPEKENILFNRTTLENMKPITGSSPAIETAHIKSVTSSINTPKLNATNPRSDDNLNRSVNFSYSNASPMPANGTTSHPNIMNNTITKASSHIPKPKPTVTTVDGPEINESIPLSRTKNPPLGMPRKIDYIVPVIITIVALPILGAVIFVLYRRGRDCWDKRHYRRMDFLIDGMYND